MLRFNDLNVYWILFAAAVCLHHHCYGAPIDQETSADKLSTVIATATETLSLSDLRVDESELMEYAAHSQAEDSYANKGFKLSLLPEPERTAESAKLEHEGIPSRILTKYDNTQAKANDLLNIEPIVDTISEHEKYGNNGDMFDGISRSIVNGYEAFSNLLNKIIEKPKEIARSISKSITKQLDIIGGKIVGLA